ncbi:hypothetical protein P8452_41637 [Trifolium repens]|nr:hypothetical protein P8452_41637 [Trifolium repens]
MDLPTITCRGSFAASLRPPISAKKLSISISASRASGNKLGQGGLLKRKKKLREGGFGPVYKGTLTDGKEELGLLHLWENENLVKGHVQRCTDWTEPAGCSYKVNNSAGIGCLDDPKVNFTKSFCN